MRSEGTITTGPGRERAAAILDRIAALGFAVAIVLGPWVVRQVVARREPPPQVEPRFTDLSFSWAEVAILVTLVAWALSLLASPRTLHAGPRIIWAPVVVLVGWMWVGVPFSVDPPVAAWTAASWTLTAALGLYVVNEVHRVDRIVVPVALMIAVQAVTGIGQSLVQGSLGLWTLGERGLDPASPGVSVVGGADGTRWLRAHGLTAHPNILGGVLAFGLVAIAGALAERARWRRGAAIGLGVIVALAAVTLVLTFSRSAWLATVGAAVTGAALLVIWREGAALRRWAAVLLVAGVAALPVLVAVAPYVAVRATADAQIPTEARSVDERIALTWAALAIIEDRPLFGAGVGAQVVAMRLAAPGLEYPFAPAHVAVLDAAAETGIPGGIAFALVAAAPWWLLARGRRRSPELAVASALVLAVLAIGLLDHYPWSAAVGRTWTAIAMGLWVAAWGRATREGTSTASEAPSKRTAGDRGP